MRKRKTGGNGLAAWARRRLRRGRPRVDLPVAPGPPPPVPLDVLERHPGARYVWDGQGWILWEGRKPIGPLLEDPDQPPGPPPPVPPDLLPRHPKARWVWRNRRWVLDLGEPPPLGDARRPDDPELPEPPPPPSGIPTLWKLLAGLVVVGVISLVLVLVLDDGDDGDRTQVSVSSTTRPTTTTTTRPSATTTTTVVDSAAVDALAQFLGLPREVVEDGLRRIEAQRATQQPSGTTALPPDPALTIVGAGDFAVSDGRVFIMELDGEPQTAGVAYQYGLGVAIDGQPLSTPNPSAPAGFGRNALSRVWFLENGAVSAFDPAQRFAPVPSGATGGIAGRFVAFRVPLVELGPGRFWLQGFGRRGDTTSSPAAFVIIITPRVLVPEG